MNTLTQGFCENALFRRVLSYEYFWCLSVLEIFNGCTVYVNKNCVSQDPN